MAKATNHLLGRLAPIASKDSDRAPNCGIGTHKAAMSCTKPASFVAIMFLVPDILALE